MPKWRWPEPHLPPTGGYYIGPSLRDQFAMSALTGLLAVETNSKAFDGDSSELAKCAYRLADAMLKAREL